MGCFFSRLLLPGLEEEEFRSPVLLLQLQLNSGPGAVLFPKGKKTLRFNLYRKEIKRCRSNTERSFSFKNLLSLVHLDKRRPCMCAKKGFVSLMEMAYGVKKGMSQWGLW